MYIYITCLSWDLWRHAIVATSGHGYVCFNCLYVQVYLTTVNQSQRVAPVYCQIFIYVRSISIH